MPWLTDRKWAHIRLEGQAFGDVPLIAELKLEVWDSPNSAGIVTDAVRCCKLALNNGLSGQLDGPSSYLMKSPMHQRPDSEARELTEKFIDKYSRPRQGGRAATSAPSARKDAAARLAAAVATGTVSEGAPGARSLAACAVPGLAIAQVTPFAWEAENEIQEYVRRVSEELADAAIAC